MTAFQIPSIEETAWPRFARRRQNPRAHRPLRAGINLGNIVLAQTDGPPASSPGVTVELARELGRRLDVPVELTRFDAAGKSFEAMKAGSLDIVFLAIEPVRAAEVAFSAPYVLIEGVYMVPKDLADPVGRRGRPRGRADRRQQGLGLRPLPHPQPQACQAGARRERRRPVRPREAGGGGGRQAADRRLCQGALRRCGCSTAASWRSSRRWAPPRAAMPARAICTRFVEEMKASGFVADALKRSNQPDASVAPPA